MLPDPPAQYDQRYMQELIQALEQELSRFTAGRTPYKITGFTTTREIDLTTASQDDVNNFVLTVLYNLYRRGLLT